MLFKIRAFRASVKSQGHEGGEPKRGASMMSGDRGDSQPKQAKSSKSA